MNNQRAKNLISEAKEVLRENNLIIVNSKKQMNKIDRQSKDNIIKLSYLL